MLKVENILLAIIAILWVIFTYFILTKIITNDYNYTILKITAFSTLWVIFTFIIFYKEKIYYLWPIILGLLFVCWWPLLTWFSTYSDNNDYILTMNRWYNTFTFKISVTIIIIVLGYLSIIIKQVKNKKYKKQIGNKTNV